MSKPKDSYIFVYTKEGMLEGSDINGSMVSLSRSLRTKIKEGVGTIVVIKPGSLIMPMFCFFYETDKGERDLHYKKILYFDPTRTT